MIFRKTRLWFICCLRIIEHWVAAPCRPRDCSERIFTKHCPRMGGQKADRVELIYNAIVITDAEVMEKPEGEQWIVSVGRLAQWKGCKH